MKPSGARGEVADEHPVEAGVLVGPGERADRSRGSTTGPVAGSDLGARAGGAIIPMNSTGIERVLLDWIASARSPAASSTLSSCGVWMRLHSTSRRCRCSGWCRVSPGLPTSATACSTAWMTPRVTATFTSPDSAPARAAASPPTSRSASSDRSSRSPARSSASISPTATRKRGNVASGAPRFDGARSLKIPDEPVPRSASDTDVDRDDEARHPAEQDRVARPRSTDPGGARPTAWSSGIGVSCSSTSWLAEARMPR